MIKILFVFSIISFFLSCRVPPPQNPITDPKEMITYIKETQEKIWSLRALATVDQLERHGRMRGDLYIFVQRRSKLRFDAIGPMGIVAILTSDNKRFAFYEIQKRRFYTGPAHSCNISRLIKIPLPPEDIATILLGGVPLIEEAKNNIHWDYDGYYILKQSSELKSIRQKIYIVPEHKRLKVIKIITFNRKGKVLYEVRFSDFFSTKGVFIAQRIRYLMPSQGKDIMIRYQQIQINQAFPPDTFSQKVPSGVTYIYIECET
jgi:outer membrane lipoprotein-sorting protein